MPPPPPDVVPATLILRPGTTRPSPPPPPPPPPPLEAPLPSCAQQMNALPQPPFSWNHHHPILPSPLKLPSPISLTPSTPLPALTPAPTPIALAATVEAVTPPASATTTAVSPPSELNDNSDRKKYAPLTQGCGRVIDPSSASPPALPINYDEAIQNSEKIAGGKEQIGFLFQ
ncbi:proline-rich receptor-like protein kinase PERK2 [Phragmites australis]|uniref:proline-rich receptor-like protein kinase PERK2 n=1 Tax=Phragmites australis TaxID=29695 RepID=UPI002D796A62|nr:proline-rich receptor-like protein kinase PERK2 [Phragmites australis]